MPTITHLEGGVAVEPRQGGGVVVMVIVSQAGDRFVMEFNEAATADHIAKLQTALGGHRPSVLQRAKPSLVVPGVRMPG